MFRFYIVVRRAVAYDAQKHESDERERVLWCTLDYTIDLITLKEKSKDGWIGWVQKKKKRSIFTHVFCLFFKLWRKSTVKLYHITFSLRV